MLVRPLVGIEVIFVIRPEYIGRRATAKVEVEMALDRRSVIVEDHLVLDIGLSDPLRELN